MVLGVASMDRDSVLPAKETESVLCRLRQQLFELYPHVSNNYKTNPNFDNYVTWQTTHNMVLQTPDEVVHQGSN